MGGAQLAAGTPGDAIATLEEALAGFEGIQARYDAARVWLDLAEAALASGDSVTAAAHRERARQRFVELHVPR